jgi:hypothetical protein
MKQALDAFDTKRHAQFRTFDDARQKWTWVRPHVRTLRPPASGLMRSLAERHDDVVNHVAQAHSASASQPLLHILKIGRSCQRLMEHRANERLCVGVRRHLGQVNDALLRMVW